VKTENTDDLDQRVYRAEGEQSSLFLGELQKERDPDKFDSLFRHIWRDGIFSEYLEGVIHGALYVIVLMIALLTIVLWFQ